MTERFTHVHSLTEIAARQPTYLAIGSFDGVHIGHQAVLNELVRAARQANVQSAVLTFFPHPKRVVKQLTGPYYLSTLAERERILKSLGVNLLITHPFDEAVRQTKAATFIDQLLAAMDIKQLWGGDFSLGHNREGDTAFLKKYGAERGFVVKTVNTLTTWQGQIVSSSRVRQALLSGNMAEAWGCLGRPYRLSGPVTMGDQRGRTIGFPTANIEVWPEQLLPANGVYATLALLDGHRYAAATNIGLRPTVDGHNLRVEAHLLDFSGNIYGEQLELLFIERVRAEKKFDGLEALKAQIAADIETVRHQLATVS